MSVDVHLVVGSTASGKSTVARELAQSQGAVRFSIDEWMTRLFGPDRPEAAGYDFYAPRIERCSEQIWALVTELVRVGAPSVLEIGLTQRAARNAAYERVARAGLRLKLYSLEAPAEVRWQRVEARNQARGTTFSMEVTREMFDFVEGMWEPPDERELAEHEGERIDTSSRRLDATAKAAPAGKAG
jgi:predicted kinase